MLLILLAACVAPAGEDPALVLLSESARLAGAAVSVGGEVRSPVMPVWLAPGEPFAVRSPDGPLDVALGPGEVLLVDGGYAELTWLQLGQEVSADILVVQGDRPAVRELATLLGGEVDWSGADLAIRGEDVLLAAAGAEDLDGVVEVLVADDRAVPFGVVADFGRGRRLDLGLDPGEAPGTDAGAAAVVPGVDVPWELPEGELRVLPGGTRIADVVVGEGDVVEWGDTVVVHYAGWLTDGTLFDSSRQRGLPATLPLPRTIDGFREGVVGMRVGGTRQLVVPPQAAYGPADHGPIPGWSTLIFAVEMLEVVHEPREPQTR